MTSLSKNLSRLGVKTTLKGISHNANEQPIIKDGYVIQEYKKNISILGSPFSFQMLLDLFTEAKKFDLIHFNYPCVMSLVSSFLLGEKKPYIITYHADITKFSFLYFFLETLERSFLFRSSAIVVTSPQYKETSIPLKRVQEKTHIITIGIDEIKPRELDTKKLEINILENIPKNFFLFVGVNRKYKGLHELLEVAKKTPRINFVIAGPGTNTLTNTIVGEGHDNIIILDEVDDMTKSWLLNRCDAVIAPSQDRAEALGLSLIEGAMFGKPLISCDIGTGTSFVNKHGLTGLVVKAGSVKALKKAVLKLSKNKNLREEMGQNSVLHFKKEFKSEKMAVSYKNLYQAILEKEEIKTGQENI